jgi:hypothetical protein
MYFSLYITIKEWKIYNGKIEVVSFDIEPGRNTSNGVNKGNNKITELRTILQRESQNS